MHDDFEARANNSQPWKRIAVVAVLGFQTLIASIAAASDADQASANGPSSSASDSGAPGEIHEIVVTAERRETPLSKTPIAITVLSASDLTDRNIISAADLEQVVPAMQIGSFGPLTRIALRGVGMENYAGGNIGGDSGVSFNVDGIPYTRSQMYTPGFFDVDRIEVLRGPQGTLYGRNAIGGAINIVPNKPTDNVEGYGDISVGSRDLVRTEAAVGGPIDPGILNGRIAVRLNEHDGDLRDVNTGGDLGSVNERQMRLMLDLFSGQPFNIELSGDYYQNHGTAIAEQQLPSATGLTPAGVLLGGTYTVADRTVSLNNDGFTTMRIWGGAVRINDDIGFGDLSLNSAYRHMDTIDGGDLDGTTAQYLDSLGRESKSNTLSSELTLTSNASSLFEWVGGLFYLHEDGLNSQNFQFYVPFENYLTGGDVKTDSYAGYLQGSYPILTDLKLSLGGRYSTDTKTETEYAGIGTLAAAAGSKTWHAFTPRGTLDWTISDSLLGYFTVARGYKSGGWNVGSLQGAPYAPEYVWDYEGGLKTHFFDRRVLFNVGAYHYNYSNMQELRILGLNAALENAAAAHINGVEMDSIAHLIDALSIDWNYAFTDAKFTSFMSGEAEHPELGVEDLAGNTIPNAPKSTFDAGISYKTANVLGGSLTPRLDVAYRSKTYFSPFDRWYTSQSQYSIFNGRLQYQSNTTNLSIALFCKNILNKTAIVSEVVNSSALQFMRSAELNEARIYGIDLGYKF